MASTPPTGFEFNRPTIIAALYLVGALTGGLIGLVGLVLAYVWRGDNPQPWEATHYTYAIRTFWIAIAAFVVGLVLAVLGIGLLILLAIPIWLIVRSVVSLLNAQKRSPMPDPETFLI